MTALADIAAAEHAAFLAAIIMHPADDLPRLVLADWLEEHAGAVPCGPCAGTGFAPSAVLTTPVRERVGPDGRIERYQDLPPPDFRLPRCPACKGAGGVSDGRRDRAAFIRVQCELARLCEGWTADSLKCLDIYLDPQDHESQEWKHKVWGLQQRARELLASPGVDPRGPLCGAGVGSVQMTLSRGFVAAVTCSAEAWLRHADRLCWHPSQTVACPVCAGNNHDRDCPTCDTEGVVPRPCPPTAQPVTAVTLTDLPRVELVPYDGSGPVATIPGVRSRYQPHHESQADTAREIFSREWPGVTFTLPADPPARSRGDVAFDAAGNPMGIYMGGGPSGRVSVAMEFNDDQRRGLEAHGITADMLGPVLPPVTREEFGAAIRDTLDRFAR